MAAAKVRVLTPEALLTRLQEGASQVFQILDSDARNVPARQNSLRATLDWSYGLLDQASRKLFAILGSFVGGWTLAAAEAVALPADAFVNVAETIGILLENSLVQREETASSSWRFRMLEPIHQYAQERLLASGEAVQVQERHARYFLALAEQLAGSEDAGFAGLEEDYANLRAALRWMLDQHSSEAARLAGAMWRFWWQHGHISEGRQWLDAVLMQALPTDMVVRRQVLAGAGVLAFEQGDYAQAERFLSEVAALQRERHDMNGVADTLIYLGQIAYYQGAVAQARMYLDESLVLHRQAGNAAGAATALLHLGVVLFHLGDLSTAYALQYESLQRFRGLGNAEGCAVALNRLAQIALHQSALDQAIQFSEQSIALLNGQTPTSKRSLAFALINLSFARFAQGDLGQAIDYQQESLALYDQLNHREGIAWNFLMLGGIYAARGDGALGARLWAAAERLREIVICPLPLLVEQEYQRYLATFRARYDPVLWETAWAHGRAIPLDQAVADALADADVTVQDRPS